jgi:hypothetical protein
MRKLVFILPALVCALALLAHASAQPPRDKPADDKEKKDYSNAPIVVRMMAFNKKKDGKLTKVEVTDERLHRLFDQADTNKDGVVTKEELMALAARLDQGGGRGGDGPGGRGPGGPGGRGGDGDGPGGRGPGGRGPGGPGPDDRGPGGRGPGGPPQPGVVLPPRAVEQLQLTDEQKKQLDALQKDVDAKLAKILTEDQKKQLKEMRERGPGGRGPGGRGPGGRGPGGDGPGGRGPGGRGPGGDGGGRPRPDME